MINKYHFIGQHFKNIHEVYEIIEEVGSGYNCNVFNIRHRLSKEIRTCKKIYKTLIENKERIILELDLLRAIDHPHIIKLFEVYEDKHFIYFVMEYCKSKVDSSLQYY